MHLSYTQAAFWSKGLRTRDRRKGLGAKGDRIDGCGAQRDIGLWHEMFAHEQRVRGLDTPVVIENCHDGMSVNPPAGHGNDPGNVPHRDSDGHTNCDELNF